YGSQAQNQEQRESTLESSRTEDARFQGDARRVNLFERTRKSKRLDKWDVSEVTAIAKRERHIGFAWRAHGRWEQNACARNPEEGADLPEKRRVPAPRAGKVARALHL